VKQSPVPEESVGGKDTGRSSREPPAQKTQGELSGNPTMERLRRAQQTYGNRAFQRMIRHDRAVQNDSPEGEVTEEELAPAGGGQQLDNGSQSALEAHFGADLAHVRVHTDSQAARGAESIDAQAYTAGRDIYFAPGMYSPSTSGGQRLLAHEVAHVVQQSSGKEPAVAAKSAHGVKIGASDDSLEADAERASQEFMSGDLPDEEQRKRRESSPVQRQIQRQTQTGTQPKPDWRQQLNELVPRRSLLDIVNRHQWVQILEDMFGEEAPVLVGAISASVDARQFVTEEGMSAILALGETSLSHGVVDAARARAWLAAKPDRYSDKNIGAVKQERAAVFPDTPQGGLGWPGATKGATKPSFDDALREGAASLGKASFGLSTGSAVGIDANDGYDARDFEESPSRRDVLISKVEPWMAINSLVKNIGKDVPKAGGGTTKWSFDCFDFVTILRIYAYWRTLSRTDFNTKFGGLELGFFSKSPMQWQKPIEATKPGEQPFRSEGTQVIPGTMTFREVKVPVGQSWQLIVASAPVGTQITWANQDAKTKCTKDPSLSFCPYMYENTTKLGPDSYSAHPMGIVDEQTIKQKMAEAVFGGGAVPAGYIARNIFISTLRVPIR
jgi:hypothetical protein